MNLACSLPIQRQYIHRRCSRPAPAALTAWTVNAWPLQAHGAPASAPQQPQPQVAAQPGGKQLLASPAQFPVPPTGSRGRPTVPVMLPPAAASHPHQRAQASRALVFTRP